MHHNRQKQQIVLDNPELVLCENGDFKIKADLVEQYEIIDMYCHIFSGLSQLFPAFLQKEKFNKNVSLMDMSCFPFSLGLFDLAKIDNYMKMDIKGWKLNPHIWGVPIDCDESIALLKELAKTNLPIMSCSGIGLPQEMLDSAVPTKQTKKEVMTQHLPKFEKVLDCISDTRVILAHSGCFDFEFIVDIMNKYPNTYTDISIQPAANIKKLIGEIGSERILFGTDYPFVTQAFSMLSVLRATNDEEERRKIFCENAKKLLGI